MKLVDFCIGCIPPLLLQRTPKASRGDSIAHGYAAGISIEPHMVVVFHDAQAMTGNEDATRKNFVEYGQRLEQMLGGIQAELIRPSRPA